MRFLPGEPMSSVRVLLISHTCQSRTEGQPKAALLGRAPEIDIRLLVPDRWFHNGVWRHAERPDQAGLMCEIGKVVWPWAGPGQFYMHWYPGLPRLLKEFKPHIIDLWEEPWGLVSAQACYLRSRLLPAARILSETEQNINKVLPPPFETFRKYTLGRADFAVARSTEASRILRGKGYRGPIEVVPNAVDAELFRPLDREQCRRDLGTTGFVAGYVGRMVEEKGVMDLVDALPYAPAHASLLLVGSGPYQPALAARARDLGVCERVRFMPNQPLTELPVIMNAIDVLVLPSRTMKRWKEQFGRVIIEANACGTPVIGSRSGAIPDVVGAGGVIVSERDPRGLGLALTVMESDVASRRAMGAAGRAQVEALYTWQRVADRMRDIYLRMACGAPISDA
jgi:glycosyltransferase involved in cell wall biosynthesis